MPGFNSAIDGVALPRLARDAVEAALSGRRGTALPPDGSPLWAPGASFVTLERSGVLRGCVGTVVARRPLCLDVAGNAESAARDPRLPPVTLDEVPHLDVKVSVLSDLEPVAVAGSEELAAALRPGLDGVLLDDGERRATFLPAVWRKVDDPERFIAALLRKGGWSGWPAGVRVCRYTCAEYADREPEPASGPEPASEPARESAPPDAG
jgi:AmmeMemoRadiSam system protein A